MREGDADMQHFSFSHNISIFFFFLGGGLFKILFVQ